MDIIDHISLLRDNSTSGYDRGAFELLIAVYSVHKEHGDASDILISDNSLKRKLNMTQTDLNNSRRKLRTLEILDTKKTDDEDYFQYNIKYLKRDMLNTYYDYIEHFWKANNKRHIKPEASKLYFVILRYLYTFGCGRIFSINRKGLSNLSGLPVQNCIKALFMLQKRGLLTVIDYVKDDDYNSFSISLLKRTESAEKTVHIFKIQEMFYLKGISAGAVEVYRELLYNIGRNKMNNKYFIFIQDLERRTELTVDKLFQIIEELNEKNILKSEFSKDSQALKYSLINWEEWE